MTAASQRAPAILIAILFFAPAASLFAPTAQAATGSGAQILTDPSGDQGAANGLAADVLRIGASSDATQLHFYTLVTDKTNHPKAITYDLTFTVPGQATDYVARVVYATSGAFTTSTVYQSGGIVLANGKPMTSSFLGNELVMNVTLTDIGSPASGVVLSNINMVSWAGGTGATFDTTVSGTYTMGTSAPPATVASAPQSLSGNSGSGYVRLSWLAPASDGGAAITSYNVLRGTAPGAETSLASTSTLTFNDTSVTDGTTYYYTVKAVNSAGVSPASNEAVATPGSLRVPGAPLALNATAGSGSVALSWNAPADNGGAAITGYNIYRGTASNAETLLASSGANTSYTDATGAPGVTYFFKVTAKNSVGEGPASDEASAAPNVVVTLPTYTVYRAPSIVSGVAGVGFYVMNASGSEPSIGVNPRSDATFFQQNQYTLKTLFNNSVSPATATWIDVTPPNSRQNIDPILFTDPVTGLIFAGGLDGECSVLGRSSDDGASWTPAGNACTGVLDHQTIGGGAYRGPVPATALSSRIYYYCAQNGNDACVTTTDNGTTFGAPVLVSGTCSSLHGHVKSGPDGVAYLPNSHCGANQGAAKSEDNGATWTSVLIPGTTARGTQDGFDPSVAITPDNKVYFFGGNAANAPFVSISSDHGATWSLPVDIAAASGISFAATTFHTAVAGDNGRVAVAYMGTQVGTANLRPWDNGYHGVWSLYVTMTLDGGATWQTVKATSDPTQRGCIWSAGGSNVCRNMLDFMDVNLDSHGRVIVGFADGCVDACAASTGTEGQSTAAWVTLARQSTGKTLYAAFDGSVPEAPLVQAYPLHNGARLSWTPSTQRVTGYQIYRGLAPTGQSLVATTGNATSFTDAGLVDGTPYYYYVAGINDNGAGAPSAVISVTPFADATPPSAVTGLAASGAADRSVTLSWNAASDNVAVDHYEVYRGASLVASPTLTSFTDSGLQNGATYTYSVRAIDLAGNGGGLSASVDAKPIRTIRAALVASDPSGDATTGSNAAMDLLAAGMGWDGATLRIEWPVADASAMTAPIRYDMAFTENGQSYLFEFERGGTRCNLYTQAGGAGLDPVASQAPYGCGVDLAASTVWGTVPSAALRNVPANGTQITAIVASDCLLVTSTSATGGLVCASTTKNDTAPNTGSATFTLGTPNSAGHIVFAQTGTIVGAEASALNAAFPATSPEGDKITFSATGVPSGAAYDAATSTFSWTPTYDQAGTYAVTVSADTGAVQASETVSVEIANVDRAPVLDAIADQTVSAGTALTVTPRATDADGDALSFAGSNLPAGASVDAATGVLSFTPARHAAATYSGVQIAVTDGNLSAARTFAITVLDQETAPVLDAVPALVVAEGGNVVVTLHATDAEGDAIQYAVTGAPANATFDATQGVLTYSAPFAAGHDAPVYALQFSATDGTLSATQDTTLTVSDVNRAPTLATPANPKVNETQLVAFAVSATDADGDATTLSGTGLPEGATFDASTGQFSWTPGFGQSGNYPIAFSADDSRATTTKTVIVTVGDVNRAPVFDATPVQAGAEGSILTFAVHASDPDNDAVTYGAANLPAGAAFDAPNATFSWKPGFTQAGTYVVRFTATDGSLATSQNVTVTIANTDRAPVVSPIANIVALEGTPISFTIRGSDPDGTAVALSVATLPVGASFTDNGNGAGTFAWTPSAASHGTYGLVATATSTGLTGTASFVITVKFRANFTVAAINTTTIHASPGQSVDFEAVVTNNGVETDTYNLAVAQSASWGAQTVNPLTLAPGESQRVQLHVVVPAAGGADVVTLFANSTGQIGASHNVAFLVDVPVVLTLVQDNGAIHPWQRETGFVRLTYLDGTNAVGVKVTLKQTPSASAALATTLAGTTDANGLWFYDFGNDVNARTLGQHTLLASAALPGVAASTATGGYTVG